jgi:hypothetical protein
MMGDAQVTYAGSFPGRIAIIGRIIIARAKCFRLAGHITKPASCNTIWTSNLHWQMDGHHNVLMLEKLSTGDVLFGLCEGFLAGQCKCK